MRIHLLSDLHNEFFRREPKPPIEESDADVVVLAGDIDVGLRGLEWAAREAERLEKPVLYVAGNHEYYHHDIELIEEMRSFAARQKNLHLLENDELVIGDVRFLGCTLWTDYQAAGDPAAALIEVRRCLSDHRVIWKGEWSFLPEDALGLHFESRKWLEVRLASAFDGSTVVVTHHAPHRLCQHPSFPLNPLSTAFLSDLGGLVEQADMWCFGHTHSNLDTRLGGCRLVSNQRGYPKENVKGFEPSLVLQL